MCSVQTHWPPAFLLVDNNPDTHRPSTRPLIKQNTLSFNNLHAAAGVTERPASVNAGTGTELWLNRKWWKSILFIDLGERSYNQISFFHFCPQTHKDRNDCRKCTQCKILAILQSLTHTHTQTALTFFPDWDLKLTLFFSGETLTSFICPLGDLMSPYFFFHLFSYNYMGFSLTL